MTRVLVCGGRDYSDTERAFEVLDRLHSIHRFSLVIHGACGWDADDPEPERLDKRMLGADCLADCWAVLRGVPCKRVPAAWNRLGRKAGPIRNSGMLAYTPDMVVAFPGGKGTANMCKQARKDGIVVLTVIPGPAPVQGEGSSSDG